MKIVQKYGGSSLSTIKKIKDIAKHIKKIIKPNDKIIIVCSAMGKTTNQLIAKAKKICWLPNRREYDLLLSTGEIQSIALLSMALIDLGVKAKAFNGENAGFKTNANFNKSFIRDINTKRLEKALNKGYVCVVAGFQGISPNKDITTFGRGGSDITAVALSAKLGFDCEIYTDVDGVYSMDPRIYKNAKKLSSITYDEMIEMAVNGAKVLDSRCVEIAKKFGVKIYLGKTLEKEMKGTYVMDTKYFEEMPITSFALRKDFKILSIQIEKKDYGKLLEFFSNLNLNYELFNLNKYDNKNIVTFGSSEILPSYILDLQKNLNVKVNVIENLCKVTLIGIGFSTHNSQLEKIERILSENHINFDFLFLNDSSISFVTSNQMAQKTVEVISKYFGLE